MNVIKQACAAKRSSGRRGVHFCLAAFYAPGVLLAE